MKTAFQKREIDMRKKNKPRWENLLLKILRRNIRMKYRGMEN